MLERMKNSFAVKAAAFVAVFAALVLCQCLLFTTSAVASESDILFPTTDESQALPGPSGPIVDSSDDDGPSGGPVDGPGIEGDAGDNTPGSLVPTDGDITSGDVVGPSDDIGPAVDDGKDKDVTPSKETDGEDEEEKVETPTVTKQVFDKESGKWQTATSASIGDKLSYRLVGTMVDWLEEYDEYYYYIIDKPSNGVTIDLNSVIVTLVKPDGKTIELNGLEDLNIDLTDKSVGADGKTLVDEISLKVGFDDIKASVDGLTEDDLIVVEYEAKLNADATIGAENPNDNFAHVDHTTSQIDKGITHSPEVFARVITLSFILDKVSETSGTALAGAKFTLASSDGSETYTLVTDKNGMARVDGIGAGTYILTETEAPKGYNKAENAVIEVKCAFDDSAVLELSVTAKGAEVLSTNAAEGTMVVRVADPLTPDGSKDSEIMPKTGVQAIGASLVVIGAVIFFLSYRSLRKSMKQE